MKNYDWFLESNSFMVFLDLVMWKKEKFEKESRFVNQLNKSVKQVSLTHIDKYKNHRNKF